MSTKTDAWAITDALIESLQEGRHGLSSVPGLLLRIIEEELWREFYCEPLRKVISHKTFNDYISDPIPSGLGADARTLQNLCRDDERATVALREALKQQGGDRKSQDVRSKANNIKVDTRQQAGTSKAYTLSRLEREAPELFEQVCEGQLSANAAAIKAGIRKKKSPEELVVHNWRKSDSRLVPLKVIVDELEPHEKQVLLQWLTDTEVKA